MAGLSDTIPELGKPSRRRSIDLWKFFEIRELQDICGGTKTTISTIWNYESTQKKKKAKHNVPGLSTWAGTGNSHARHGPTPQTAWCGLFA